MPQCQARLTWKAVAICALCSCFLVAGAAQAPPASSTPPSPETAPSETEGAAVEVDGRPLFSVYASIGGTSPAERAHNIAARIVGIAQRSDVPVELITVEDHGSWSEIVAGSELLLGITEDDARGARKSRTLLASEYAQIIRITVRRYREDHSFPRILWAIFQTVAATAALFLILFASVRTRGTLFPWIERWLKRHDGDRAGGMPQMHLSQFLTRPAFALARVLFWIVLLAVLQAYVTVVLRFFPATRYTSYQITNWLFSQLAQFAKLAIGYVPNLILVVFICLVTFFLLKINLYFFDELRAERLTIRGFYADWAGPTAKLVRLLIIAGAAVVVFPYLPGSSSPAFKGISVFIGVLLSLGSSSAMAHGIAGTILTYMRAYQVGDFVKIGNEVGEVVEKTLLVTRICTQKREVVTIPNGTVLGGMVINYSAEARQKGVIFHTVVTIGYTAPWRQVHELLVSAALATEGILQDPEPFVLQTALNDFYVSYELNAYTAKPMKMLETYSKLHQNIQDRFNEAGVEINSPHYASLRSGEEPAVPEEYLPNIPRNVHRESSAAGIAHAVPEPLKDLKTVP